VAGYVLAILGAIIGNIIVSTFVDAETGTNQAAEVGMQNPEVLLLLIPASFLLIGPGEELLFRGIVQGRLREVMSAVPAILITAAFFAGIHFFALTGGSLTGNLAALGVLTLPALVFGVAYEYTDNIAVPSLIHGAYNATLFSLLYAAIRFGGNVPSFWV
jgi:CAAX amino terminal protease family.